MNLLSLVFKQMRQRALGTWLTLLSVLLGVALATAVLVFQREGDKLFTQADFGYDVLVGPARGSPLQLTLNTIYHLDVSPGLLDYDVFKQLRANRGTVRLAIPIAVGDTYGGLPIVGTSPRMFNHTEPADGSEPQPIAREGPNAMAPWEYRREKSFELAEGRMFHPRRFEAVIGADVSARTDLRMGTHFHATHGNPKPGEEPDVHTDKEWVVVGRLARTGTAADRAIYIPLLSFYALGGHEAALETINAVQQSTDITRLPTGIRPSSGAPVTPAPATQPTTAPVVLTLPDGSPRGADVSVDLPESEWKLSAVLVRTRSAPLGMQLLYTLNNSGRVSASNPAKTMREFFDVFLRPSTQILLAVALMVIVVAALGIVVAIYNSVSARLKEIAVLRALGATRRKVLTIICLEAGLIGVIGTLLGVGAGLLMVASLMHYVPENLGQVEPFRLASLHVLHPFAFLESAGPVATFLRDRIALPVEVVGFVAIVLLSLAAGLVPALKAYRVPVAANLST